MEKISISRSSAKEVYTYTFGIENKRFETNNKHYLIKLESFPFYNYSIFIFIFLGKVGFESLIWKNIKKRTPIFINHVYMHPF